MALDRADAYSWGTSLFLSGSGSGVKDRDSVSYSLLLDKSSGTKLLFWSVLEEKVPMMLLSAWATTVLLPVVRLGENPPFIWV